MKTTILFASLLAVAISLVGCDLDNDHDLSPAHDATSPATPYGDADGVEVDIDTPAADRGESRSEVREERRENIREAIDNVDVDVDSSGVDVKVD